MTSWLYTVGAVVALLAFIYFSAPAEQQDTVVVQQSGVAGLNWSGVSDNMYFGAVSGNFSGSYAAVSTGLVNLSGNFTGSFQYANGTRPCQLTVSRGIFTGIYALEAGQVVNMSGAASEWDIQGRYAPQEAAAATESSTANFLLLFLVVAGGAYYLWKHERKRRYLDDRAIDGKLRRFLKEPTADGEGYSLNLRRTYEHESLPKADRQIQVISFDIQGGEFCCITYDVARDIFFDFKRRISYADFREQVARKTVFVDEVRMGKTEKPIVATQANGEKK